MTVTLRLLLALLLNVAYTLFLSSDGTPKAVTEAGPTWDATSQPKTASFLTIRSGHSYTLLAMGPVRQRGRAWAWEVPFLSLSSDPAFIRASADELFEMARQDAENAGLGSILMCAVLSYDPVARTGTHHCLVFERGPVGWKMLANSMEIPSASPALTNLIDGWGTFTRDRRREEAGAKAANDWLRLLDNARFDDVWKQASPLFRAGTSREEWNLLAPRLAERGRIQTRTELFRLYTGYARELPPATYLVMRFATRLMPSGLSIVERLQLRLEEDGRWRISGYSAN
jgi:hypothetical protein